MRRMRNFWRPLLALVAATGCLGEEGAGLLDLGLSGAAGSTADARPASDAAASGGGASS